MGAEADAGALVEGRAPVSLVVTVFNEAASVGELLTTIAAQTRPPDEVVIVDGGSTDGTVELIRRLAEREPALRGRLRLLVAPGANIAAGRNRAIAAARHDLIAVTDAGVRLEPDWLARIVSPLERGEAEVVAGFFRADPRTVFELAMGATVLPTEREIDPARFLPSSRSVAFTRAAWSAVGGYPEWLDYCEDVVFDLALRARGCRFAWVPGALVHFRPRGSLRAFFLQYYRYARGDGKADLFRRRHMVRYGVYLAGGIALGLGFWYKRAWLGLCIAGLPYLAAPYGRLAPQLRGLPVRQCATALALVPLIRFTGDVAKMLGYPAGWLWRVRWRSRSA